MPCESGVAPYCVHMESLGFKRGRGSQVDVVDYLIDDNASMSAAIISRFKAFSIPDDDPRRYTYLTDTRTRLFPFIGDMFDDYESIPARVLFDIQFTD